MTNQTNLADPTVEIRPLTPLNGGIMGIVSGMKGGAPAGALMGAVIMGINMINTPVRSLWWYTVVVGLTLGMMAGATFGAGFGFLSGTLSIKLPQLPMAAIWYIFATLFCLPILWLMLAPRLLIILIMAILCIGMMGYFSHREFQQVIQLQSEPEDQSTQSEENDTE